MRSGEKTKTYTELFPMGISTQSQVSAVTTNPSIRCDCKQIPKDWLLLKATQWVVTRSKNALIGRAGEGHWDAMWVSIYGCRENSAIHPTLVALYYWPLLQTWAHQALKTCWLEKGSCPKIMKVLLLNTHGGVFMKLSMKAFWRQHFYLSLFCIGFVWKLSLKSVESSLWAVIWPSWQNL